MRFYLLALLVLSGFAFGSSKIPSDDVKIGIKSSTNDKGITFETGDGASNVTLKVDDAKKLKFDGNDFSIGDGASVNDKTFTLDPQSGAYIGWDGSESKIVFDNGDGNVKKIGSGSGAGGGENFNNAFTDEQNANAQNGIDGWVTVNGTLTAPTTDPLEGEASFSWIATAQDGYVESAVLDLNKDVFRGTSCEARIEYVGGAAGMKFSVVNGLDEVLTEMDLPAHGIFGQESLFFLCPNATDIAADAQKGNLRYRITDSNTSGFVAIKFDKSYLGTLRGLTETTLPDTFTATIQSDGTISRTNAPWIDSVSIVDTSLYVINYSLLGLSNSMDCVATVIDTRAVDGNFAKIWDKNFQQVRVRTYITNSSTSYNESPRAFSISCTKSGTDAKQSVQVYKSIPKVSENVNTFSANITAEAVIQSQSSDIFDNCTEQGPSPHDITCNFKAGALTTFPTCAATANNSSSDTAVSITILNSDFVTVRRVFGGTPNANIAFTLVCQKQGDDFRLPTVQPIIVGQVTNSYAEAASKNVRVESCFISESSGVYSLGDDKCDTWIDSLTKLGTGNVNHVFPAGTFKTGTSPICFVDIVSNNGNRYANIDNQSDIGSRVDLLVITGGTPTSIDSSYNFLCVGER